MDDPATATVGKCKRCGGPCDGEAEFCAYCTIDRERFMQARELRLEKAREGLLCPSCGGTELPVWYTRKRNGTIKRVRKCRACGRSVVSVERVRDG